jgi:hypothetical protein
MGLKKPESVSNSLAGSVAGFGSTVEESCRHDVEFDPPGLSPEEVKRDIFTAVIQSPLVANLAMTEQAENVPALIKKYVELGVGIILGK